MSEEEEPLERVAARLVLLTQNPKNKRLLIQAVRAHLFARAGDDTYKLIREAEHALALLDPGPIIQSNKENI